MKIKYSSYQVFHPTPMMSFWDRISEPLLTGSEGLAKSVAFVNRHSSSDVKQRRESLFDPVFAMMRSFCEDNHRPGEVEQWLI